jgi:hypothetical protein
LTGEDGFAVLPLIKTLSSPHSSWATVRRFKMRETFKNLSILIKKPRKNLLFNKKSEEIEKALQKSLDNFIFRYYNKIMYYYALLCRNAL